MYIPTVSAVEGGRTEGSGSRSSSTLNREFEAALTAGLETLSKMQPAVLSSQFLWFYVKIHATESLPCRTEHGGKRLQSQYLRGRFRKIAMCSRLA